MSPVPKGRRHRWVWQDGGEGEGCQVTERCANCPAERRWWDVWQGTARGRRAQEFREGPNARWVSFIVPCPGKARA